MLGNLTTTRTCVSRRSGRSAKRATSPSSDHVGVIARRGCAHASAQSAFQNEAHPCFILWCVTAPCWHFLRRNDSAQRLLGIAQCFIASVDERPLPTTSSV